VALTSHQPAGFRAVPAQGALLPGSVPDMVIWDPQKQVNDRRGAQRPAYRLNLYEGWELTGYPEKVFLRGALIVDGENWLATAAWASSCRASPAQLSCEGTRFDHPSLITS